MFTKSLQWRTTINVINTLKFELETRFVIAGIYKTVSIKQFVCKSADLCLIAGTFHGRKMPSIESHFYDKLYKSLSHHGLANKMPVLKSNVEAEQICNMNYTGSHIVLVAEHCLEKCVEFSLFIHKICDHFVSFCVHLQYIKVEIVRFMYITPGTYRIVPFVSHGHRISAHLSLPLSATSLHSSGKYWQQRRRLSIIPGTPWFASFTFTSRMSSQSDVISQQSSFHLQPSALLYGGNMMVSL